MKHSLQLLLAILVIVLGVLYAFGRLGSPAVDRSRDSIASGPKEGQKTETGAQRVQVPEK